MLRDHFLLSLFTVFFCLSSTSKASPLLLADTGFVGTHLYIEHLMSRSQSGETEYRFRLCGQDSIHCIPISSCSYSETEIRRQVEYVVDNGVYDDFSWFFLRGGKSSVSLKVFFDDFKALLQRIHGEACPIPSLEQLIQQVEVRNS